jgi:hypothetical protein
MRSWDFLKNKINFEKNIFYFSIFRIFGIFRNFSENTIRHGKNSENTIRHGKNSENTIRLAFFGIFRKNTIRHGIFRKKYDSFGIFGIFRDESYFF